ncbi:MAG: hypothetical protein Q4B78_05045 [Bacillota bacterium]|nr:hypothetical protein [Bacillota bacterium]
MSAYATQNMGERETIVRWFEQDFKQSAMRTTKTSRAEDGKVNYSFSVTNNSDLDFDRFAFRVKILNKITGEEIGSATINAGAWAKGETKNFKSKINIPRDVKSISFLMYSESIDYDLAEIERTDQFTEAIRDIGEMLSGENREGGVLGELFGTGGMPETTVTKTTTTTTTRNAKGRTTRTSTTSTSRTSNPNYGMSYSKRMSVKKLNKIRMGKSSWSVVWLVFGILFFLALLGSTGVADIISYGAISFASFTAAAVLKVLHSNRGKRIRFYESKVNLKGNTSIDDLSYQIKRTPEKVADDLQRMIVDGFFPEAYVDMNNRLLVMTKNGEPIESVEKSAATNNKARRKAARDSGLIPSDIDDLIVMIDDEQIKAKLKGLRAITKRIDARIEARPELNDQVKEFREKYYPEVVRLTDEYNEKIANLEKEAKTEQQTSELEINANPNYLQDQARQIKGQLVKLIDSVTEASENLLEKLHEDDITDITTDIQTLQTTLASRGLLDSDFDIKL